MSHPGQEELVAYLYGELDRRMRVEIQQHLDSCPDCLATVQVWRGAEETPKINVPVTEIDGQVVIKRERMPDGRTKLILKDKQSGKVVQKLVEE